MQEKERAGGYVWAKEEEEEEANWEKIRKLLPELGFKVLPRRGGWWSGRSRGQTRTAG